MPNSETGFAGVRANPKFLHELLVQIKASRNYTKQEHLISSVKASLHRHEEKSREPNGRNNFLMVTKPQNHTHTHRAANCSCCSGCSLRSDPTKSNRGEELRGRKNE